MSDVFLYAVPMMLCPHCEIVLVNVFPLPPYLETDPDPPPHYDDLFPPGYTPLPNPNTHPCPSFNALPPVPSFTLDPPPSYDSLFATAVPPDSAEGPHISQIIGVTHIYGTQMMSWTGTCSSSPSVHPHTLLLNFSFSFPLLKPSSNLIKKDIYTVTLVNSILMEIWRGRLSSKVV